VVTNGSGYGTEQDEPDEDIAFMRSSQDHAAGEAKRASGIEIHNKQKTGTLPQRPGFGVLDETESLRRGRLGGC
jgi:hypothetical protein